ncbi:hypothetical protein BH11PSE9_BH11PSE9_21330 [soil metagenome]
MNALVDELKTRARLGLNAIQKGDWGLVERAERASGKPGVPASKQPVEWKLRHCLALAAREVGFGSWDQARRVLSGRATAGDDMGGFWHVPRCNGLLSHWFASYGDAQASLAAASHRALLPYRHQFVVVDDHYLRELGLSITGAGDGAGERTVTDLSSAWQDTGRDLVAAYGSTAWAVLCGHRLRASRAAAHQMRD